MTVVQRTGNKKVTLVDNLDLYGISAEEVAHMMKKIAAASTTGNCFVVYIFRIHFVSHIRSNYCSTYVVVLCI